MVKVGRLEGLKRKLRMDCYFVVDPLGIKGGLALFWKNEEEMEVKNYSNWPFNVVVKREGDGREWLFTGFYGILRQRRGNYPRNY